MSLNLVMKRKFHLYLYFTNINYLFKYNIGTPKKIEHYNYIQKLIIKIFKIRSYLINQEHFKNSKKLTKIMLSSNFIHCGFLFKYFVYLTNFYSSVLIHAGNA